MMPPSSVRMLMFFLLAAAFLNFSNYTYMTFYKTPGTRMIPTQSTMNSKSWFDKMLCETTISVNSTHYKRTSTKSRPAEYSDMYDPVKAETILCPELPPGLGPVNEGLASTLPYARIYSEVSPGGVYNTTHCISRHSVAIIVPYRGSEGSLASFLYILHPFLMKQQLNYQIFVIEQSNTTQAFNRGKLLNVGFTEARRQHHWDCFVFHEPNIIPVDSRNLYRCGWYPKQLAIRVDRPPKPPYTPKIGGALALTEEQFLKVNGFSNSYWGNDADYEDLLIRFNVVHYQIEKTIRNIGKYKTLKNINMPSRLTSHVTETVSPLYLLDGLSTLTYTVKHYKLRSVYTQIQVNIDETIDPLPDSKLWDGILNQSTYLTNVTTSGSLQTYSAKHLKSKL